MNNPGQTHFVGDDCPGGHYDEPPSATLTEEEQRALLAGAAALDLYRDENQGDILRDLLDRLTGKGEPRG